MKKLFLIVVLVGFYISALAQNVDKTTNINAIELGVEKSVFGDDLYLITGDEPAYKEAPSLQYALKRKIMAGIRDASYLGNDYRKFGNFEATNITMQFYNDRLFKVQWTFRNRNSLKEIYDYLVDFYADKLGAGKEGVFDDFRQVEWEGHKNYVQVFMDNESDVTLVFEDVKVSKKVQKVLANSK
ncbi:MAG: hypothetical protein KDC79_01665 [Cyclobacteriaceae bacterium]|nr:hypothetical protein [Cyclobacteriaceae bacterium]